MKMNTPKSLGSRLRAPVILFAALGALTVQPVFAATDFWLGGVSSGNWSSGGSWLSGNAPAAFDSLVFTNQSGAGDTANNDFSAGMPFDGIRFDNSSAASTFSLTGNGILLSGATNGVLVGITNATALTETVGNNLTLDWGYYTFNNGAGGTLALNGTITANTGALAYFPASGVTSSSFTTDGNGLISSLDGFGLIGTNTLALLSLATVSGGNVAPLPIGSYTSVASGVIGSGGNIELSAATTTAYTTASGVTVNTITTDKNPGNSGGSQTITVTTTGTLTFGSQGGLYVTGSGSGNKQIVKMTGGTITSGTTSSGGTIVLGINGTTTGNQVQLDDIVANNAASGPVTLIKTGPGSMYMDKANTYSGGTYVDEGYLQLNGASEAGTGPIYVVGNGGTIYPNTASVTWANNFYISPGLGASISSGIGAIKMGNGTGSQTLSGTLTLLGNPVTTAPGDRISGTGNGGTANFTGQITGTGTLELSAQAATATFVINNGTVNANNWTGGLLATETGNDTDTVKIGANNQLANNTVTLAQSGSGTVKLDLNGFSDSIGGLSAAASANNQVTSSSGTPVLTIGANNATATFGGVISSSLGLVKTGSGAQTISGANTYTGNTTVNAGKLVTTTASTGAGNYTVTNASTLDVQVASAGAQLSMSSLTMGNSGSDTSTLQVDTQATGNPSVAPINITGALNTAGTVNIQLSGTALAVGTFPLISYGSESPALPTLNLITSPRISATLSDNGSVISVTINSADPSIEWLGGVSGNWDINDTGNTIWQGINSHTATYYIESADGNDAVMFDDNATGTTTVNVTTTVTPAAVSFNNSTATYTLNGTGKITGAAGLTKNGTGTATLSESGGDNFAGGITMGSSGGTLILDNAGSAVSGNTTIGTGSTLQIGNNDAKGNFPGTVTDNGTLTFDRSDAALSVATLISGSGAINNNGSGTVTLSATPNAPATTVNGGILELNAGGGNGCVSNNLVVNASGELDLNANDSLGYNAGLGTVTVSGTVKKLNSQSETLGRVIILSGGTMSTTLAGVEQYEGLANYIQTAASTVNYINGPGIFGLRTNVFYFTNAPGSTLTISCVMETNKNSFVLNPAPLNKYGTGTLTLSAANTYNGPTIIYGGTLALTGSGSIANSSGVIIAGGATFDVSGLSSTFTLASGQLLTNSASTALLNGAANTGSGTVSLTYASGTPSLTVSGGALTLSSGTTFKINNTGTALEPGSYKIISSGVGGSVAVSGALPSASIGGSGIAGGTSASLAITGGELYLVVTAPTAHITGINLSGTTLMLTATNGAAAGTWTLLQSTNIALPLSQWETNTTGSFDGSGNLSTSILNTVTNTQEFYILEQ